MSSFKCLDLIRFDDTYLTRDPKNYDILHMDYNSVVKLHFIHLFTLIFIGYYMLQGTMWILIVLSICLPDLNVLLIFRFCNFNK